MNYGTITEATLQSYIASGEIKSYTVTYVAKNGTKTIEGHCKCDRCGGLGKGWWPVDGGICYKCHGTGIDDFKAKVATEEQIAKNEAAAKKRAAKKEAQRKADALASVTTPLEGKVIADWLDSPAHGETPIGIIKETAKAYLILTEEYLRDYWIPKSALLDKDSLPTFPTDLKIKDWFLDKNIHYEAEMDHFTICRETEKAYQCRLTCNTIGDKEDSWESVMWIPKSCMERI